MHTRSAEAQSNRKRSHADSAGEGGLKKIEQNIRKSEFLLLILLLYDKIYAKNSEVLIMPVSYNKLWKLLIDKNMKRTDLRTAAKISTGTLAKLGKNEGVSTDVLVRICRALECDIGDIMEVLPDVVEENYN